MNKTKYSAQRVKLQKEIEKLQKQAAALEQKERAPVISEIVRSMREYDITLEAVQKALNSSQRGARKPTAKSAAPSSRAPVPPKYRDPATGTTWTGRGRAPRWITEAEAQGKNRDEFLIKD